MFHKDISLLWGFNLILESLLTCWVSPEELPLRCWYGPGHPPGHTGRVNREKEKDLLVPAVAHGVFEKDAEPLFLWSLVKNNTEALNCHTWTRL